MAWHRMVPADVDGYLKATLNYQASQSGHGGRFPIRPAVSPNTSLALPLPHLISMAHGPSTLTAEQISHVVGQAMGQASGYQHSSHRSPNFDAHGHRRPDNFPIADFELKNAVSEYARLYDSLVHSLHTNGAPQATVTHVPIPPPSFSV